MGSGAESAHPGVVGALTAAHPLCPGLSWRLPAHVSVAAAKERGSVTNSCALTPWWKGAYSSRAIAKKALVGIHRTDLIDIQ